MNTRTVLIVIGLVLVAVGAIWTLQGLDVIGGSAMSGTRTWAVIGPVVVVAGAILTAVGYRRPR